MLILETVQDLQRLLDEREAESLTLEFKAGDALGKDDTKKADISKDASAFANSAGGQLIYGIKERDTKAFAFAPVDGSRFNREWLENVLRHHIRPAIEGLSIKQIHVGPAGNDVVYVVTIPQGTSLAPHQANDNRYYRRFNFQAVPMADYEIRDAMRRLVDPDLRVDLKFSVDDRVSYKRLQIRPTVINASSQPALYVALTIFVDRRLGHRFDEGSPFESDPHAVISHPDGYLLKGETGTFAAPAHFPVFRGRPAIIWPSSWEIRPPLADEDLGIAYRISAPGCLKEGFTAINVDLDRMLVNEMETGD